MKKFILGLFALVLSFSLIACGDDTNNPGGDTPGDNPGEQEDALKTDKENAIKTLEELVESKDQTKYKESEYKKITDKLASVKTEINNSESKDAINTLVSEATAFINSVPEKQEDPVEKDRKTALDSINRYLAMFEESDYSETNWALILGYYNTCVEKINGTTVKEEMDAAVSEAKSLILVVLTVDEEEYEILLGKINAGKEQLTAYFESLPESDYEYSNYYILKVAYEDALVLLDQVEAEDEIQGIIDEAIVKMDAIPKQLKIVYNNVEDAKYRFIDLLSLRTELLNDYNAYLGKDYTFETLPLGSFENFDFDKFYFSGNNREKWNFLINFLADKSLTSTNKAAYSLLSKHTSYDEYLADASYNIESTPYSISYELRALISLKPLREGNSSYGTNNFADNETLEKALWTYAGGKTIYEKGETYTFPEPFKKYQDFLGWYTNPEFTGEPVTGITPEDNKPIILYAKWSELTNEGEFGIYRDQKVEEFNKYFEDTKDINTYNTEAWNKLLVEFEEEIAKIKEQTTKELVDAAFESAKQRMDNNLPTIFTVTYELNGGHWYFETKEQLVAKFLKDYGTFKNATITKEGFFEASYGSLTNFFVTHKEWVWLLDLLKDYCLEGNEKAFDLSSGLTEAQVRADIAGYMLEAQMTYSSYTSGDYSDTSLRDEFKKYATTKDFTYLEPSNELMIPILDGYKFLGWYANSDFSGAKVESVNQKVTLYAKWEFITDEVKLVTTKEEAVNEITAYKESLEKVSGKYTEEGLAELANKLQEAIELINGKGTIDEVNAAKEQAYALIDSVKDTSVTVTYVLDGGHWYYENHDKVIEALIAAINNGSTVNVWAYTTNYKPFLTNDFDWLLRYFISVETNSYSGDSNVNRLSLLLNDKAALLDDIAKYTYSVVVKAFTSKGTSSVYSGGLASADYSNQEILNKMYDFMKDEKQTAFNEVTLNQVVFKEGYTFVGWYDNAEFNGEALTSVTDSITVYAKWVKNN